MALDAQKLGLLQRKARWVELRIRVAAALRALTTGLPFAGIYALASLTWIKVQQPSAETESSLLVGLVAVLVVVVALSAFAALRPRPKGFGARALDRHHGLSDRIASALAFSSLPASARTPFMDAAIVDAVATAVDVKVRAAAPVRPTKDWAVTALLLLAIGGLSLVEVRQIVRRPPLSAPAAVVLNAEDVELLKEVAQGLAKNTTSPEVSQAVQRFNQLIEDIAERRVEREEVFRRVDAMEQALLRGLEAEAEALDEGLRGIAQELDKSRLAQPVAEALKQKRLKDAEDALRELAKKLKETTKPDPKELERLRKALQNAGEANSSRMQRIAERRQELEDQHQRLLKKKKDAKTPSAADDDAVKRNRSELQRLERNQRKAEAAKKQLSQLDKDLAEAARKLMEEMGDAAKDLESGAQDIHRAAEQELSNEQKQALKKRLEELREMLRQQGQGSKDRAGRMKQFGQRARGQKPGQGEPGGDGKGSKGPPQISIGRGAGGVALEIPGGSSSPGAGPSSGEPGVGSSDSKQWGTGTDANLQGKETNLEAGLQDVSAAGVDSGQGVSTSQVIHGAAQRGFVGKGYQQVFTDYQTVAEELLQRDEIPPGHEFYVRRYFQLIRPREAQATNK